MSACRRAAGKYTPGGVKAGGPRSAMFTDDRLRAVQPLLGLMRRTRRQDARAGRDQLDHLQGRAADPGRAPAPPHAACPAASACCCIPMCRGPVTQVPVLLGKGEWPLERVESVSPIGVQQSEVTPTLELH